MSSHTSVDPVPSDDTATVMPADDAAEPAAEASAPVPAGLVAGLVALGAGLLAGGLALSVVYSRYDGALDYSNFIVGVGATAALLLAALGAALLVRGATRAERRRQVLVWGGTLGTLGAAAMTAIAVDEAGYLGYLTGSIIVGLSLVGFAASRAGGFVVTGVLGLGLLYASAFDDLLAESLDDERFVSVLAVAVGVFTVAMTLLGWLLPTRVLSGVVAGWVSVVGLVVLLVWLWFTGYLDGLFADVVLGMDGELGPELTVTDSHTDVWVILAVGGGLTLMWALAAVRTGHAGFTLLAVAMPATATPLAALVVAAEHPTWWGVGLVVPGAVLLALAGILALRRGRGPGHRAR